MRRILTYSAALVAIAGGTLPAAVVAQTAGVSSSASYGSTQPEGYVLGPGDVVEVSVLGREDYRARVKIQVDGTIQLPLIGTIKAANRTTLQLKDDVGRALVAGGYFAKPVVVAEVASYSSRYVTVLGEVAQPGLVPIDRAYRVSEILARVGGVKEGSADVVTLRRGDGTEQQLDLRAIATGSGAEDPAVTAGDKVFVAQAQMFYIYGQVRAPGSYKLDSQMTLRKAIARGGGLTDSGSEKRAKVVRAGVELKKYDLDAPIKLGDVVVVGERFF